MIALLLQIAICEPAVNGGCNCSYVSEYLKLENFKIVINLEGILCPLR